MLPLLTLLHFLLLLLLPVARRLPRQLCPNCVNFYCVDPTAWTPLREPHCVSPTAQFVLESSVLEKQLAVRTPWLVGFLRHLLAR